MALFKRSLDQIKSMLGQLTFSQQMLMVCLLVIVIVSVVWLMNYSGQSDMVPLLDQQFEAAEQGRLIAALRAAGIEHKVADGRVLVSPADRNAAFAAMTSSEALPHDFSFGFEQVVNDSNIWRSQAERDRMWHVAVENELAGVLRRLEGVTDAKVIIDRPERRGFGAAQTQPTAAVHLRMRAGQTIDKKLISAVADWVSGAVRGLPREQVKIIDSTSGRSYRVPSDDAAIPADLLELTKQYEQHYSQSILKAIGHIENVLVSVSVKVDSSSRQKTAVEVDKANVVSVPSRETSSKTTSSEGAGGGGEPGVVLNTGGVKVPDGGSTSGSRSSDQTDDTEFENKFGETRTVTTEWAGSIKEVSATVNIPRSYFLDAYKAETGEESPDAAVLKNFMTAQVDQIKPKVLAAIGMTVADAERVALGWYYDKPASAVAETQAEPAAGTMGVLMSNAGSIGLGTLAVIALLAMLLMMKKAASSVATIAPAEPGGAGVDGQVLGYVSDSIVGDAGMADGYLQGVEVDEETLRTQKMVEQVGSMVRDNPESAANLVRRWISKKPNGR